MNCLSLDSPPSPHLCKDQYEENPLHKKDNRQAKRVNEGIYFSIKVIPATLTEVFLKFSSEFQHTFLNSIMKGATTAYLQIFTCSGVIMPNYSALHNTKAQLVEALHYKPEGCRFNSQWCHWNFH
jgi:hypothetical protein